MAVGFKPRSHQRVAGGGKAFDRLAWDRLVKPDHTVPDKAQVALGFDGSKSDDLTALIATEVFEHLHDPVAYFDAFDAKLAPGDSS